MVQLVFAVFDEKAAAFLPPFYLQTQGIAERAITDCVNDPKHQFGAHPQDYTLFKLAEFDNQSGKYTACKKPLKNCLEYKTQLDLVDPNQLTLVEDQS